MRKIDLAVFAQAIASGSIESATRADAALERLEGIVRELRSRYRARVRAEAERALLGEEELS